MFMTGTKRVKALIRFLHRNKFILIAAQVVQVVSNASRAKIIAWLIGPTGTGIMAAFASLNGLFSTLTSFGIGTLALRDYSNGFSSDATLREALLSSASHYVMNKS